ncbi:hypothetical protein [Novosphingobium huizhouense]|uniref:hypothetical protein n=1 Tax=Novosphingobium huizhouense TaxID=2866625 RepID=UPI001CD8CABD|nr:hypothetical protein [Novosphingobium huizhouense]
MNPRALAIFPALALALAGAATPAHAAQAKLVRCGAADCLLVTGQRADPAAAVTVNDHPVAVAGGRRWKAKITVATVRAWSEPHARSIAVAVAGAVAETPLPTGMLGHPKDLAMLVVRAR